MFHFTKTIKHYQSPIHRMTTFNTFYWQLGVVEKMGNLTITSGSSAYSQEQLDDANRRLAWEHGQIDYLGIDSFDLIQAKLQESIEKKPATNESKGKAAAEAGAAAPSTAPSASEEAKSEK